MSGAPAHERIICRPCGAATLLLLPDPGLPMVRFLLAQAGGSVHDPVGQSGRLDLTFELLLRGTGTDDFAAFTNTLEGMGSSLDAQVGDAAASLRGIALSRHWPATWALATAAWQRPTLAAAALPQLLDEAVDAQVSSRDDDEAVAEHFLRRALYGAHPLGRAAGGEVADLRRLRRADLRACHGQLGAEGLLVALAGDIEVAAATAQVTAWVASLPPRSAPLPAVPALPALAGLRLWVVDKPGRSQVQLRLASQLCSGRDPEREAVWLGATAFGGTFTSPLTRAVRDERGWSYVAQADFDRRSPILAPLVLRSAPALGDAVNCLALELDLLAELAAGQLAPADLQLARDYLLGRYPFALASAADMMGAAAAEVLLGHDPAALLAAPARLAALDLDSIGAVMQRHLASQGQLGLLVGPAARLVPELQRRFPSAEVHVVDYQDGLDDGDKEDG